MFLRCFVICFAILGNSSFAAKEKCHKGSYTFEGADKKYQWHGSVVVSLGTTEFVFGGSYSVFPRRSGSRTSRGSQRTLFCKDNEIIQVLSTTEAPSRRWAAEFNKLENGNILIYSGTKSWSSGRFSSGGELAGGAGIFSVKDEKWLAIKGEPAPEYRITRYSPAPCDPAYQIGKVTYTFNKATQVLHAKWFERTWGKVPGRRCSVIKARKARHVILDTRSATWKKIK